MTVIDTSALMAVLLDDPRSAAVAESLATASSLAVSAGTLAEALIVARRRGVGAELAALIDGVGAEIVPVTRDFAVAVADAYDRWGRGVHPAALNFGDCFSYALAREREAPLLFVGYEFLHTDVQPALAPG
ncbi:MAG: type II toxin-antitoxin system VapC family toxin [Parvularculaceae bacterium]